MEGITGHHRHVIYMHSVTLKLIIGILSNITYISNVNKNFRLNSTFANSRFSNIVAVILFMYIVVPYDPN